MTALRAEPLTLHLTQLKNVIFLARSWVQMGRKEEGGEAVTRREKRTRSETRVEVHEDS